MTTVEELEEEFRQATRIPDAIAVAMRTKLYSLRANNSSEYRAAATKMITTLKDEFFKESEVVSTDDQGRKYVRRDPKPTVGFLNNLYESLNDYRSASIVAKKVKAIGDSIDEAMFLIVK